MKTYDAIVIGSGVSGLSAAYGLKEAGKTVHFFERVVPTITLSATADIIQTGDTVDVNAKQKITMVV